MILKTCLAVLEAQGVLVVLVLNRLMKSFLKTASGKIWGDAFQIMSNTVIVNDVLDHSALGPVVMMMYVCVCACVFWLIYLDVQEDLAGQVVQVVL